MNFTFRRGLGHAVLTNMFQSMDKHDIQAQCDCLQAFQQMETSHRWDQGQVFFLPDRVWGMPNYYSQQMLSATHRSTAVRTSPSAQDVVHPLSVYASRDRVNTTAGLYSLVIRVVNVASRAFAASVVLEPGCTHEHAVVELLEMSGDDLGADNLPPAGTEAIVPRSRTVSLRIAHKNCTQNCTQKLLASRFPNRYRGAQ